MLSEGETKFPQISKPGQFLSSSTSTLPKLGARPEVPQGKIIDALLPGTLVNKAASSVTEKKLALTRSLDEPIFSKSSSNLLSASGQVEADDSPLKPGLRSERNKKSVTAAQKKVTDRLSSLNDPLVQHCSPPMCPDR